MEMMMKKKKIMKGTTTIQTINHIERDWVMMIVL
jgi:hypothetical protein